MLKAVFFDLDGTLLPLDEEKFTKLYFGLMCQRMAPFGYNKEELINVIWSGTKKMYLNDGTKTNEEVFWDEFVKFYGVDKLQDKETIDEFYKEEFRKTIERCQSPILKVIFS